MAGSNCLPIWQQNSKKGETPGRYPDHYTDSFTAKNTCTDNYGALYCKIHSLRPDLRARLQSRWIVREALGAGKKLRGLFPQTLFVCLSRLVRKNARVSECPVRVLAILVCRILFFSPRLALHDGCVVFFVHVLPSFKAPWGLERQPVS